MRPGAGHAGFPPHPRTPARQLIQVVTRGAPADRFTSIVDSFWLQEPRKKKERKGKKAKKNLLVRAKKRCEKPSGSLSAVAGRPFASN